MSTPIPLDSAPVERPGALSNLFTNLLREPLVVFLVAGGLLFGIDHALHPTDSQHHIVVPADITAQAREGFRANRGRDPDAKELAGLRQVWIDNEVLYREGLAQQTDRGDDMIRDRVIFKKLLMVDAAVQLPQINDAQLRAWFEAHRDKYDEPMRYTFQEGLPEDRTEAGIRALVTTLNNNTSGELKADLRVFRGRPVSNVVDSYGQDFAHALDQMSAGSEWRALQARDGWHAIRLEEMTPRKPADFAAIQQTVHQDWKEDTAAQQRTDEVRRLGRKYTVTVEPGKP
ncbi:MAG: peptidylprolyl isomerase [Pseudomonadota bacterium]